jgi:outer membrane lipoprotein-sorting protein
MLRRIEIVGFVLTLAVSAAVGADAPAKSARLSATEIVDRNVAARGGLRGWREVITLKMAGNLEAGGNDRPTLPVPGKKFNRRDQPRQRPLQQVQLPFVMEMKRPRKTRLEIKFAGQTALQVYDGSNGWKLRPFLNRHQVEPFTEEELKASALQSDLDGPLVDYIAKGTKVELEGIEKVEGKSTYKLKLTLKSGQTQHVWVDAQTFLEAKIEGAPRRLDGKYHAVSTYFRDYRAVNNLMIPYVFETAVEGVRQTEKIQLESVSINPQLEEALFAKLQ